MKSRKHFSLDRISKIRVHNYSSLKDEIVKGWHLMQKRIGYEIRAIFFFTFSYFQQYIFTGANRYYSNTNIFLGICKCILYEYLKMNVQTHIYVHSEVSRKIHTTNTGYMSDIFGSKTHIFTQCLSYSKSSFIYLHFR